MSQRNVELFMGRLLTDAELRRRFAAAPLETVSAFCEQGWELNRGEIDALAQLDMRVWYPVAASLPSRLQRCSLCAGKERDPAS